jgi:glycosyltransferase involved in cell wall biosynthesis
MTKARIALLVPGLSYGGGVPAVARFLYRVLQRSDRYLVKVISLATSAHDLSSVRLLSPRTWVNGVRWSHEQWQDISCRHVGAVFSELEFQRYRARRTLTNALRKFDLVQVVAGTPAWALVAERFQGPLTLQVATLCAAERRSSLNASHAARRIWSELMTTLTTAMERAALARADMVYVENTWMFDHLRTELGAAKVCFAPPGVDTEFFRPQSYQPDGPILWVGRFSDPRKNLPLLLEAYAGLRKLNARAPKLVLAGATAPSDEYLALVESLGLTTHVEFHCDVLAEDLRHLYQNASLFVLSSDEEGLGMVILEAMASGLPVVSTNCGGPATAVVDGQTGHLTPVRDAGNLAVKLHELIESSEVRKRMSGNARRVAEERFSLDAAGKPYLESYEILLARG